MADDKLFMDFAALVLQFVLAILALITCGVLGYLWITRDGKNAAKQPAEKQETKILVLDAQSVVGLRTNRPIDSEVRALEFSNDQELHRRTTSEKPPVDTTAANPIIRSFSKFSAYNHISSPNIVKKVSHPAKVNEDGRTDSGALPQHEEPVIHSQGMGKKPVVQRFCSEVTNEINSDSEDIPAFDEAEDASEIAPDDHSDIDSVHSDSGESQSESGYGSDEGLGCPDVLTNIMAPENDKPTSSADEGLGCPDVSTDILAPENDKATSLADEGLGCSNIPTDVMAPEKNKTSSMEDERLGCLDVSTVVVVPEYDEATSLADDGLGCPDITTDVIAPENDETTSMKAIPNPDESNQRKRVKSELNLHADKIMRRDMIPIPNHEIGHMIRSRMEKDKIKEHDFYDCTMRHFMNSIVPATVNFTVQAISFHLCGECKIRSHKGYCAKCGIGLCDRICPFQHNCTGESRKAF